MSFIHRIIGYPTDRLTPARSYTSKRLVGQAICANYRLGKYIIEFEFISRGDTVEEWFDHSIVALSSYQDAVARGWVESVLSTPFINTVKYGKDGYTYSFISSKSSVSAWSDKELNGTDKLLISNGGLQFLQLTSAMLSKLKAKKSKG